MSTFIVRFVNERTGSFRGKARHVASGEEASFADERELLAFLERMKVLGALARNNAELLEAHRADPLDEKVPPDPDSPAAGRPPVGNHEGDAEVPRNEV